VESADATPWHARDRACQHVLAVADLAAAAASAAATRVTEQPVHAFINASIKPMPEGTRPLLRAALCADCAGVEELVRSGAKQGLESTAGIGLALRNLAPKSPSIRECYIGNHRKCRFLAPGWPAP
jgi:hypothetical protein